MREKGAEVVREPLIIKYSGFANQMKRITCMDPITTAIVSSLSAGAAFVGKEAATEGIKDAYAGLKAWIQHHYSRGRTSSSWKSSLHPRRARKWSQRTLSATMSSRMGSS